ncbi:MULTISPECIES: TetR/AcrR family transcriptional regulator [Gluconobacter]|uniref:Division inhibitor protein n=1 Tax=Gluconobacter cerinus TaxID=38307 RepID=A0A1B6VGX9_9PROT|nr:MULTISPECIES: TetR family transcriptional regulator [Gluconobacter]OAG71858.1 division inhibitor protein [Gluconobacter japonicus]MBS1020238.1 TetR family transcriptional regulator [Gluconobacter cerinus]MBS1032762.1 TetR family transcriptional regulator [Gluconobacter cerinus]MBS1039102.1 TetR family transcriptional regulator [Gluconobacter cerinus]MBS1045250.1 TetR family transcriptional regulator [Gluconobacter cerinus]
MRETPLQPLTAANILESAKAQIRRFGEAKTNVTDVARDLGVSHAALYRFYRSKSAMMDAIVQEAMDDEAQLAAQYIETDGPAAERLTAMILDLHRRKRDRFVGDREIHDLYRRIVVDRPDMINTYAARITNLVAKLIEKAVRRGEWDIDDIDVAAGVVRDAVTVYVHPAFVAQLVTANAPVEAMLHATVTTLARAFESGVHYGSMKGV